MSPSLAARPVRLAQLVVEVPDVAATSEFLARGLEFAVLDGPDGSAAILTTGGYGLPTPQRFATLVPGASGRLREVVLESPPDVQPLVDALAEAAVEVTKTEADAIAGAGVRFGVGGITVSVRHTLPAAEVELPVSSLRPRRLGHINLVSPEPADVVRVFTRALGLRLSEQVGDGIFFLRIGSEHHNIGVRVGGAAGVHHIATEVHGWDAYRGLCDRLCGLGYLVEFGPGRHGPGNNFFVYVRDPSSGIRFELFSDMAHIEDEDNYVPKRWDAADRSKTVNKWGPGPPQSFLE
jgi:catechol 2,3-dioxygenase-like lactoylglutathione lyase family enzyme